jgi:hypothetical protein
MEKGKIRIFDLLRYVLRNRLVPLCVGEYEYLKQYGRSQPMLKTGFISGIKRGKVKDVVANRYHVTEAYGRQGKAL